jgi:hypothetical protein
MNVSDKFSEHAYSGLRDRRKTGERRKTGAREG